MSLRLISLSPLAAFASLGVARAILICLATAASIQAEDTPVTRARSLVDRFEQADAEQVQAAARQLRTFLDAHPDDVQALIVAARIGWLTELRAPVVMSQGKQEPPDPAAAYKPLQDLLDRALQLEPANAEASYWKARLYGVTVPVRVKEWLDYQPIDIEQAIRFARRAVDLAPQDVAYREALAQYLVIHQEPKAAIDVLKDVRQGRHPLYVLLSDFESIPIPEGAAFDHMFSTTSLRGHPRTATSPPTTPRCGYARTSSRSPLRKSRLVIGVTGLPSGSGKETAPAAVERALCSTPSICAAPRQDGSCRHGFRKGSRRRGCKSPSWRSQTHLRKRSVACPSRPATSTARWCSATCGW